MVLNLGKVEHSTKVSASYLWLLRHKSVLIVMEEDHQLIYLKPVYRKAVPTPGLLIIGANHWKIRSYSHLLSGHIGLFSTNKIFNSIKKLAISTWEILVVPQGELV